MKVIKEYEMPAGENGGPYAVTVDGNGRVFANEIQTDTVAVLEPKAGAVPRLQAPIQERRHPQGDRGCARAVLVHGFAQRQVGGH